MVTAERTANKRYEIKDMIKELKGKIKDVDLSIFKAAQNVNMDCILGWQKDGKNNSFLEFFDEEQYIV